MGGTNAGGVPSTGGQGGEAMTVTTTSTTTTGGGGEGGEGGSPPNLCGNGVLDPMEQCEGSDFGGKSCVDFGLGGGSLICNQYCTIVVSQCVPKESCNDGNDNDFDGLTDCDDDECAAAVACTNPCGAAQVATIPDYPFVNLQGKANVLESSCAPNGGSEVVFKVTVPTDGDVGVQMSPFSFDGAISVRSACNDPSSEILCVNSTGSGGTESASFPGVAGQTYFVIFESTQPGFADYFSGTIDQPQPEEFCDDQFDDDIDGYVDCDDASNCKGISPQCDPGPLGYGENCFSNTDCQATGGDPICLGFQQGFQDGYCSEFCDGPGDCPGGGVCMDINLSVHGVCFKSCSSPADCPGGEDCVDNGAGQLICDKPPELNCQDYQDDDFDGFVDCEDATSCTSSFSCISGPRAAGDPCQIHNQCQASANDPFCIDQPHEFWTGGYCSEFCNLSADDCPTGSHCTDWFFFSSGNGLCMKDCDFDTDCRAGYSCLDLGLSSNVCVF